MSDSAQNGKMITICSAKGGIGRTLLAVNLAIALNKKNINVTLLDGDLQFGDVSLAMDLQPSFSIKDVVQELSHVTGSSIHNYYTIHSSGVRVLTAPDQPEFADVITNEALNKVVSLIKEESDYLVVDTGVGIQEQTLELVDQSDYIFIVTNLEMTALKNTKQMLDILTRLNLAEKVRLIVNRSDMESLIKAETIPELLKMEHIFYIPNNFKLASQSLNIGIPFVISQPKSPISKAIFRMATEIVDSNSTEQVTLNMNNTSDILPKKHKKSHRKKSSIFFKKRLGK